MASNAFGYKTKSIVGSVETINTDITSYSPDELSKILQLTKVTKDTVIRATNKYINKFRQENNRRLVNFFSEVQQKLIRSLNSNNERSIVNNQDSSADPNDDTDDQMNDWTQSQNQSQEPEDAILYPLGTTDRKQKIDIYDNHHNIMSQEKLAVQHTPNVVQGQINPNLKNTITRIVNIDSKYRLSAVPNVKNKKFRDIINHHTSAWSGTDFTLDFNDPLRKVLSFKLYSLQIPYSWYTIDTAYGTSCFVLKHLTTPTENIINGVSGVTLLENSTTRFVAVDGFNIVRIKPGTNNVVNFNNEPIQGVMNTENMSFFFVNDTDDIVDSNGVRVKTIVGKYMKVLVNSKNYVKTSNPTDSAVNRILDINGYPTRFFKSDFSNPSDTGTLLTTANGTLSSKLYFTIDKYGNTVTHINIDTNGDKIYEHSPKIIFDNKKAFLNVDNIGNISTINSDGTVKYDSPNTGIDLNEEIIFTSTNSFKNSATLHSVVVNNGNYTPSELVDEIHDNLKESVASAFIIATEIYNYDDLVTASIVQLYDRKIVVGGTYFDGSKKNMALCRYNTNGTLDTAFNSTGKLTISIDINDDELSSLVYTHYDTKMIIGGTSINDVTKSKDFVIGRVSTNGILDSTFGTDKTGSVRFGFGTGDDVLTSIVCENSSKSDPGDNSILFNIYAGGYSYNTTTTKYDFAVVKMSKDGSLVDGFGASGKAQFNIGGDDNILTCMALSGTNDAQLVLGGYNYNTASKKYECTLIRTNTLGVLDTSFNTTGKLMFSFLSGTVDSIIRCITNLGNGYIVGGYVFNSTSETYDFALARILSTGVLDTTFGTSGIKIIAVNAHHNFLTSVNIDISGKIIAGGYTYNGTTNDFTTLRMSSSGVMDTTFGKNGTGIVTTTIDNTDLTISGIIPNLDGKITITGTASKNSNSDFAVTRYTINGDIDSTFVNKKNEKTYASMTYNTRNGKSTITTFNKFYSVLFYKQNEPFCTPRCGQGPRANNNLGWICGFRDQEYTSNDTEEISTSNTFSFTGEAIVDTFGSRYFLLSIDDYNSNQINKAIVSIENVEKKADLPSYYSSDLTSNPACDTTNPLYSVPQYLQGRPAQITQAQQYTLNEILKNRKDTSNNVLTSPTSSNVFAVIPLKKGGMTPGDALIEFSGPIQINERNYFGPVDIDKMRVQLLDDKGNVVNLNGMDWSFSIVTEHLYQY